jgi:hypothetical protein
MESREASIECFIFGNSFVLRSTKHLRLSSGAAALWSSDFPKIDIAVRFAVIG